MSGWQGLEEWQLDFLKPGGAERYQQASKNRCNSRLFDAAADGCVRGVRSSLKEGADVDYKSEDSTTPLDEAAFGGREEVVAVLLDHGANLSGGDDDGYTPLHAAAEYGHTAVVQLLLKQGGPSGALHSKTREGGCTPLFFAAQEGHLGTVQLLVADGADVSAGGEAGTPLHASAEGGSEGNIDVAWLLLTVGADVTAKNKEGKTPEEVASAQSHLRVARMLNAAAVRRAEAFAMGHHERLGAGSRVKNLEPEVVRMVLEASCLPRVKRKG